MTTPRQEPRLPAPVAAWLARHTPSCRDIARLASEGLDRKLGWRERLNIRLHFLICYLCRRYEEQLRLVHDQLARQPEAFSQAGGLRLSEEEKARLRAACRQPRP